MELFEISDRIDTRLKTFDVGISVDEYEKSLYLTKAQKIVFYEHLKVFEDTNIISKALKPFLVDYVTISKVVGLSKAIPWSQLFSLPENVEKITYETAIFEEPNVPAIDGTEAHIRYVRAADIAHNVESPFRTPGLKEVLKVIRGDNVVELLAEYNLREYRAKYFRTAPPIILENLPDNLTIDEISIESNSLFNDDILDIIIDLAVKTILNDTALFATKEK